ncbi:unnamed protein product [Kuraishia capsulata CBS 1993]|uniref:Transcription factor 25 n=1 Tax=Kuraishia capsulata CBS 1993 TaxID=1382522 RepID=W6MG60_9ASCO|nr:uncharacterized protein KUCA_T00000956001 [Kuraishia capsulata CBS 1993]CDK24989.1 unnamed protein product [Kuraishia capsulata CBS 1993]
MSSRALRRLEKQKLEDELANLTMQEKGQPNHSNEDESSEEEQIQPHKVNAFAFLKEEEDEYESLDEEEKIGSENEAGNANPDAVEETPGAVNSSDEDTFYDAKEDISATESAKKKKRNKKKKSRARKKAAAVISGDTFSTGKASQAKGLDQLEDVEDEEFSETLGHYYENSHRLTSKAFIEAVSLLQFDPKFLDPDREFRNLFGKLPEEIIDDVDSTLSGSVSPEVLAQIRRMAKMVRGWGGKDRRSIPGTMRKLVLTKIRDDWIPTTKKDFLMMELNIQKVQQIAMARDASEWPVAIKAELEAEAAAGIQYFAFEGKTQFDTEFFITVAIQPDHEALINLLQRSPYHIETLLQVAMILYRQGQKIQSSALVERGLFVFDRSFKQSFAVGSGLCRLPFEYFLNRQFYLCIFRYIQVLTQKSTFFTALNYCKLLLSFSPEDDPYGVRHFIDFYAVLAGQYQYLIDFVNSPFCQANSDWFVPSLAYSVALAHLKLGESEKARQALTLAYLRYPYMAHMILEKVGLAAGIPAYKGDVSSHTSVATAAYLVRAHLIWDDAASKQFLHDELMKLITTIKKSASDSKDQPIPDNLIRYVILSGEDSVMAKIPRQFFDGDVFEFDVLPPTTEESETIYSFIDQSQIML